MEFWVSTGRDGAGNHIMQALHEIFEGEKNATMVENHWQSWPEFRRSIAHMHLLMQPSFTESFNMVTADGIAEGS